MYATTAPLTEDSLAQAVASLCDIEPRFAGVVAQHGMPSLRPMPQGLEGLLLTVTEQFLSLKAAAAIWSRLRAQLQPFTPEVIVRIPPEELLRLGLSRAKAKSFHAIARAVQDGTFCPDHLPKLGDDLVRQHLVSLPGVGPWTAEIYLLAALQRPDAWPWGDLALQIAAADLLGLKSRPDRHAMLKMGEGFPPFRAVAARLLWSHYRGLNGLKQA